MIIPPIIKEILKGNIFLLCKYKKTFKRRKRCFETDKIYLKSNVGCSKLKISFSLDH